MLPELALVALAAIVVVTATAEAYRAFRHTRSYRPYTPVNQPPPQAPQPSVYPRYTMCSTPPRVGPCTRRVPAFYYDDASGTCKPFVWGGCQPNVNVFRTKTACESVAAESCFNFNEVRRQKEKLLEPPDAFCTMPKQPGLCKNFGSNMFYFDAASGKCKKFSYHCGGNSNRFETQALCEEAAQRWCLPKS